MIACIQVLVTELCDWTYCDWFCFAKAEEVACPHWELCKPLQGGFTVPGRTQPLCPDTADGIWLLGEEVDAS